MNCTTAKIRLVILLACSVFAAEASSQSVIAHRGDSLNAPGNTLSAIRSARGSTDVLEMDVRRTRDGKLVLMHDARINDTTSGFGFIVGMSWDRLRTLDAGGWFSSRYSGERIPTLSEALRESYAGGMEPLVERKSGSARAYDQEFRQLGLDPSTFQVMSFSRRFARQLHRIDNAYHVGVLGFGPITPSKIRRLSRQGADFVSWNHRRINARSVQIAHNNGVGIYAWTVNEAPAMRRLSQIGVDGITTDDPKLLRRVRQRPKARRR